MRSRRRLLGAIAAALLFATVPRLAAADESSAIYRVYWAGLPAGDIKLTLRDDPSGYRDEIAIRSEGLPRVVTSPSLFRRSKSEQKKLLIQFLNLLGDELFREVRLHFSDHPRQLFHRVLVCPRAGRRRASGCRRLPRRRPLRGAARRAHPDGARAVRGALRLRLWQ